MNAVYHLEDLSGDDDASLNDYPIQSSTSSNPTQLITNAAATAAAVAAAFHQQHTMDLFQRLLPSNSNAIAKQIIRSSTNADHHRSLRRIQQHQQATLHYNKQMSDEDETIQHEEQR